MDKKICLRCKTENEQNFRFCKRCGEELPVVDKKFDFNAEVVFEGEQNAPFLEETIDGANRELVRSYVGKNHTRIMASFDSMSRFGKKTSFCAPVLILGLLSGFFGMAVWFFYRKMNKIGFLLLSITLVFSFIDIALNFEVIKEYMKNYMSVVSSYAADAEALGEQIDALYKEFSTRFVTFIPEIRNIIEAWVAPVGLSIFALYFYKNKAVKSVKSICEQNNGDPNLSFKIFLSGGTSVLRALIPFAVVFAFFFALMVFLATAIV